MRISDWSSDVCSSDLHKRQVRISSANTPFVPLFGGGVVKPALNVAFRASSARLRYTRKHWTETCVVCRSVLPSSRRLPEVTYANHFEKGWSCCRAGRHGVYGRRDRQSTRLNSSHKCDYCMPYSD